jgi:DNA-binding CsgD family transcriptional regulator
MRFRTAREADLASCLTMLHPGFVVDPAIKERMIDVWRAWLANEQCTFSIIEDPALAHPECVEACGVSVFVSDRFVEQLSDRPAPMTAARLYQEYLAGTSPVLSASEIRARNSSCGLNLFVLHFGLRNHDMTAPRTMQALQVGSAAFYFFHSGYRINSVAFEVFGEQQARFMEAGGFQLVTDFGSQGAQFRITPEFRPCLYGARKTDIAHGAVNQLSFLFHPQEPMLELSLAEQRILLRALQNAPDTDIADALGISLDAVKKAWGRIYARVATIAPYLLASDAPHTGPHRSLEKRRHLLEYVRNHLEELRPRVSRRGRPRTTHPTHA